MTPDTITETLRDRFGAALHYSPPDAWQVETPDLRLLVLLSVDGHWLRALVPLMPAAEAQPFFQQILAANFDATQAVRYGLQEGVLWGVFHHRTDSLTVADLEQAIADLLRLQGAGIDPFFDAYLETQVRQIILGAKAQGQTLGATLQALERLYAEGVLGDMGADPAYQTQALAAWQRQLTRLWPEVAPEVTE